MASATQETSKAKRKLRMLIPFAGHRFDKDGKKIGDYVLEENGVYEVGDVGMTDKDADGFLAAGRAVLV